MLYIFIINLLGFLITVEDKRRAIRKQYRISEASLLLFAAMGASAGLLSGMYFAHHKTRKPIFYIGVPILLVFNIAFFFILN